MAFLKIRAIKIVLNTNRNKAFGAEFRFDNGLNVIRGDNTAGKSTLFQTILYALGVEELLGGRGERTMQSVLKEYIDFEDIRYNVIESGVFLEIEGSSIVTLYRSITSSSRSTKLVDVYYGPSLTKEGIITRIESMYLHDRGAATDNEFGFHAFLENFIGWNLPYISEGNDDIKKLYLQMLFPAFVIEQKLGWSDFLATIPYYRVKDAGSKAIEFLLKLDITSNRKQKTNLNLQREDIERRWLFLFNEITSIANRGAVEVSGLRKMPFIIDDAAPVIFSVLNKGDRYVLTDYMKSMIADLNNMMSVPVPTNGSRTLASENELQLLEIKLSELISSLNEFAFDISNTRTKLEQYNDQLTELNKDLSKNRGAKKVYDLGSQMDIEISGSRCPTCHQEIRDSLLSQELQQTPMRLEENIEYILAQKNMIELHIRLQSQSLIESEKVYANNEKYASDLRSRIRTIKTELVSDSRIPSEADIEARIKLKNSIDFYERLYEELLVLVDRFQDLSDEWTIQLAHESSLPNDYFSSLDRLKLNLLEGNFKVLLSRFGYSSKQDSSVKISYDTYRPVIQGDGVRYNIRSDSSATDLIRALWAYSCALFKTSNDVNLQLNHPKVLMFDEPAQHSMSNDNFKTFLMELSAYKGCQSLVFASFNNSDSDFQDTTEGIMFKYLRIEGKLIKPISSLN